MTASVLPSAAYLEAMRAACRAVDLLHRDGCPTPDLVRRARTLYRQAWLDDGPRHGTKAAWVARWEGKDEYRRMRGVC